VLFYVIASVDIMLLMEYAGLKNSFVMDVCNGTFITVKEVVFALYGCRGHQKARLLSSHAHACHGLESILPRWVPIDTTSVLVLHETVRSRPCTCITILKPGIEPQPC
jgi:hypothetical protein